MSYGDADNYFKQNNVLEDCMNVSPYLDFVHDLMKHDSVREQLVELGLFETEPTTIQVRQLLTRCLFRLNDSLLEKSSSVLRQFNNHTSIGMQIRTGGKMANYKEDTTFFSEEKLDRIFTVIDGYVKEFQDKMVLFISTDSNEVLSVLKQRYSFPILTSNYYSIGHSTSLRGGVTETFYRALIDIRVLANCDHLLTTYTSSFGNTASYLSHSLNKYILKYNDYHVGSTNNPNQIDYNSSSDLTSSTVSTSSPSSCSSSSNSLANSVASNASFNLLSLAKPTPHRPSSLLRAMLLFNQSLMPSAVRSGMSSAFSKGSPSGKNFKMGWSVTLKRIY